MSSDRLAVERAAWAVALKTTLSAEFICKEHLNDYSTMLMVTHVGTPGWKAKVTLHSRTLNRTQIDIDDQFYGYSLTKRDSLLGVLHEHRLRYATDVTRALAKEVDEAEWTARQAVELREIKERPDVNYDIIRRGVNAGRYRVTLFPGHALEHLTLEQVKEFDAFLRKVNAAPSS